MVQTKKTDKTCTSFGRYFSNMQIWINLYEWIEEHVTFQITTRLPDLDNSQTFYDRLYEAFRGIWTGIAQTKPEFP